MKIARNGNEPVSKRTRSKNQLSLSKQEVTGSDISGLERLGELQRSSRSCSPVSKCQLAGETCRRSRGRGVQIKSKSMMEVNNRVFDFSSLKRKSQTDLAYNANIYSKTFGPKIRIFGRDLK